MRVKAHSEVEHEESTILSALYSDLYSEILPVIIPFACEKKFYSALTFLPSVLFVMGYGREFIYFVLIAFLFQK